jgi:hypothetical protein
MTITSRLGAGCRTPWLTDRIGGWTAVTSLTRCAFFVLGAVAAGLTAAVFSYMHFRGYLFVAGVSVVAAAEWLVVQRRLFSAGIEEALEASGLFMIALQLADESGNSSGVQTSLLIAIALLVAGLRLLNPLFITLSAVALSCAIGFTGTHHSGTHLSAAIAASLFCFAVASLALAVGRLQFRRPSYDQMLSWLVVIMPLCGYLWLEGEYVVWAAMESLRGATFIRLLPVLMLVSFGVIALIVGIRRRTHAPLIAFIVCVGCVGYELRNLTGLSLKMRLICGGIATLFLTIGLDRYLRIPRRGITSSKVGENTGSLDLLQLAGAGTLASQSAQRPDPEFKGGGGTFGGGGASGTY